MVRLRATRSTRTLGSADLVRRSNIPTFRWGEMTSRFGPRAAPAVSHLVAVVALAVAFAPCLAAQSRLPRFERTDCWVDGDWARDVRRECGWLVVPESRDRAHADTVRLAVEIFRARQQTGAAPLVFLHGGPGGAGGIRLYSQAIARGSIVSLRRDIVIYDQRGAGFSEPKLCPAYDAAADAVLPAARPACIAELEAQGIDRRAYNTAASVADLIDLRRTLGYASWDVYGVSYGARLAQEAMARDGKAIHAVVLASPLARSFSSQAEQPLSTQHALERVFAACARQPSCHDTFPNVEQHFYAAYDDLTSSPVSVPNTRPDSPLDTVRFDGRRLIDDTRSRLLHRPRTAVARLPFLLHELHAGDRVRAAREIVSEGSGNAPDRALRELINCADHATSGANYRRTLIRSMPSRDRHSGAQSRSTVGSGFHTSAMDDACASAQRHSHSDRDRLLRRQNAHRARSPHRGNAQSGVPRRVPGRGPRHTPAGVPRRHCRAILRGSDPTA